jgi:hypothetical protein
MSNVAACPACAGEAGLIGEGEREERASRLAGETDYADSGYPEEGPPGSAPDDAGGGNESAVREKSQPDAEDPPDDGKATGNPNT